jgi:hypothetical protein
MGPSSESDKHMEAKEESHQLQGLREWIGRDGNKKSLVLITYFKSPSREMP